MSEQLEVIDNILNWADARNLIKGSKPLDQLRKLEEEVDELKEELQLTDYPKAAMELGDVFVVAIIIAMQIGQNPEEVMEMAYNKIKTRKGKMIDGLFVKEEDLKR